MKKSLQLPDDSTHSSEVRRSPLLTCFVWGRGKNLIAIFCLDCLCSASFMYPNRPVPSWKTHFNDTGISVLNYPLQSTMTCARLSYTSENPDPHHIAEHFLLNGFFKIKSDDQGFQEPQLLAELKDTYVVRWNIAVAIMTRGNTWPTDLVNCWRIWMIIQGGGNKRSVNSATVWEALHCTRYTPGLTLGLLATCDLSLPRNPRHLETVQGVNRAWIQTIQHADELPTLHCT